MEDGRSGTRLKGCERLGRHPIDRDIVPDAPKDGIYTGGLGAQDGFGKRFRHGHFQHKFFGRLLCLFCTGKESQHHRNSYDKRFSHTLRNLRQP